jgi:Family of unknown function (DUF5994)
MGPTTIQTTAPLPADPAMTTIRRNRVPGHPAGDTDSTTPRTPATPHRRDGDADPVRLALIDPPAERTTLDGAWWPRTRSLSDELPGLVEELDRRGVRVTRVAYNPAAWEPAPQRLAAEGRTIRLGWFRSIDPQLLDLTGDTTRGRLDLLVVPPETAAAAARQALTAASDRANRRTPTAVLASLHTAAAPVPSPRPAADPAAGGRAVPAGAEAKRFRR